MRNANRGLPDWVRLHFPENFGPLWVGSGHSEALPDILKRPAIGQKRTFVSAWVVSQDWWRPRSQMTSGSKARYFVRNCPGTRMAGTRARRLNRHFHVAMIDDMAEGPAVIGDVGLLHGKPELLVKLLGAWITAGNIERGMGETLQPCLFDQVLYQ